MCNAVTLFKWKIIQFIILAIAIYVFGVAHVFSSNQATRTGKYGAIVPANQLSYD